MVDRVEIEGELIIETDLAYLILDLSSVCGDFGAMSPREVWVPKSSTEYDGEFVFTMPEWLAIEKGLI